MKGKGSQRTKNFGVSAILFSAIALFWFLCLTSGFAQPKGTSRLSIATGGTGGVFYVLGGGIAAILSKYMPGVEATAEVTPASVDNCRLILARNADIAFSNGDTAYDAYAGIERFKTIGKVPLRALAVLYSSPNHLVTLEGSGIEVVGL